MRPHLVPHEEPSTAAEVMELARIVARRARGVATPGRALQAAARAVVLDALAEALASARRQYALDDMLAPPAMRTIIKTACAHFGVATVDIKGERRGGGVSRLRHMVCAAARALTPLSLPQIGRALGGRDHTTVLHAVRRVAERPELFPEYPGFLDAVRREMERGARS